jgi:hypothetical protein
VAVHALKYRSEIWTKEKGSKNWNCRNEMLRNTTGYTRKDQLRDTRIREWLNSFILNNKIIKSISQWKYHTLRMEHRRIPKKILTYTPKRRWNIDRPQLRQRDQHTLQRGRNRPSMA